MDLAQRIKQLRTDLGLSQRELSKLADISHVEISRIEKRERTTPSAKNLVKLAKALQTNPSELFLLCGYLNITEESLQTVGNIIRTPTQDLLVGYLFNKGFGMRKQILDIVALSTQKNDLIWEVAYLNYDASRLEIPGKERDLFIDNIYKIYGRLATLTLLDKKYKFSFVVDNNTIFTILSTIKPVNLNIQVTALKVNKDKESCFEEILLNRN